MQQVDVPFSICVAQASLFKVLWRQAALRQYFVLVLLY
jgi:hypothetical protein